MFKFLLIFILAIYLIGYLGRIFIARWLKKMQNINSNQFSKQNIKPEGEVSIDKNSKDKKHFQKNDGEYVDYEDVK